jgi:hypothetical protein
VNVFAYVRGNPIWFIDQTGYESSVSDQLQDLGDKTTEFTEHKLRPLLEGIQDAVMEETKKTVEELGSTAFDLVDLALNQIDTADGLANAILHPTDTAKSLAEPIMELVDPLQKQYAEGGSKGGY